MATNGATWQEIAHEVQTHRESTITQIHPPIPEVPSEIPTNVTNIPLALLTTREVDITSKSPEDLVASLATGSLTSHEVTSAFLRRAGLAQRLVISLPLSGDSSVDLMIDKLYHRTSAWTSSQKSERA